MTEDVLTAAWKKVREATTEFDRLRATMNAWHLEAKAAPTASAKRAADHAALAASTKLAAL